jgi:uncharacterized protein (DUF1810 family)
VTGDPFDLQRFVDAQAEIWPQALDELRRGRKASHWMWFVFPQITGLGTSAMAQRYAIRSAEEAGAYLAHPVLGPRLREAAAALMPHDDAIEAILGGVDAVKLRSSMTLFEAVADEPATFAEVIDRLYAGERDAATLARL